MSLWEIEVLKGRQTEMPKHQHLQNNLNNDTRKRFFICPETFSVPAHMPRKAMSKPGDMDDHNQTNKQN